MNETELPINLSWTLSYREPKRNRKAALFVQLQRLPITNDNQPYKEFNVLVAEDGKGAKS